MGKRQRKKYHSKVPLDIDFLLRSIEKVPSFHLEQIKNTKYYISTEGIVYRKKGSGKYIPIHPYLYHGYVSTDLYIERRGKTVKKRFNNHRLVGKAFAYYFDKDTTLHHINHNKMDNSVTNLYAVPRGIHDLIEYEEREVKSNLKFGDWYVSL